MPRGLPWVSPVGVVIVLLALFAGIPIFDGLLGLRSNVHFAWSMHRCIPRVPRTIFAICDILKNVSVGIIIGIIIGIFVGVITGVIIGVIVGVVSLGVAGVVVTQAALCCGPYSCSLSRIEARALRVKPGLLRSIPSGDILRLGRFPCRFERHASSCSLPELLRVGDRLFVEGVKEGFSLTYARLNLDETQRKARPDFREAQRREGRARRALSRARDAAGGHGHAGEG
jgi:hypothetical protein